MGDTYFRNRASRGRDYRSWPTGAARGRGQHPFRAGRSNRPSEYREQPLPATNVVISVETYETLRVLSTDAAHVMELLQDDAHRSHLRQVLMLPSAQVTVFDPRLSQIIEVLLQEPNLPQWTLDGTLNRHVFAWLCRESCPLNGPTRGRGFVAMLRIAPEVDYREAAEAHLARHEDAAGTEWYGKLRAAVDATIERPHMTGESGPPRRYYVCEYGADPRELAQESVFPTMEELQDSRPKKAIHRSMKGACVHRQLSWEQRNVHIRTQFSLVKEDFLASLRESYSFLAQLQIQWDMPCPQLSSEIRRALRYRRDQGDRVRVYYYVGVRLRGYEVHPRLGIVATFALDTRHISPKRLMHGNLLLLVPQADGFRLASAKNAVMGTIVGGAPMKGGGNAASVNNKLVLDVHNLQTLMDLCACGHRDYVAIESTVFFTPYERVLTSLRKMDHKNVEGKFPPILATIVTGVPAVPPYLANRPFDLSRSIALKNVNEKEWDPLVGTTDNFASWSLHLEEQLRGGMISVLDTTQRDALPYALRHSVAVIQGTPGTGKTFIGVKLLQVLYENRPDVVPIVVMCQTNHAVDSFLQDVLKFVKREHVARVGHPKDEGLTDLRVQPWSGFAFTPEDRADAEQLIDIQRKIWQAKGSSSWLEARITEHLKSSTNLKHDSAVRAFLEWLVAAGERSTVISEAQKRLRDELEALRKVPSMRDLEHRKEMVGRRLQQAYERIESNCAAVGLSVDENEILEELQSAEEVKTYMPQHLEMIESEEEARTFEAKQLNNLNTLQRIVKDFQAHRNLEKEMCHVEGLIRHRLDKEANVNRLREKLAALEMGEPLDDSGDGILEWWRQQPGATSLRLFKNYVDDSVVEPTAPDVVNERAARFYAELRAQEAARREEDEIDEAPVGDAAAMPFTPSAAERLERVRRAATWCVGRNTSKADRDAAVTMLIEEVYYGLNDTMRDIVSRTRRDCAVGPRSKECFHDKHVIGGTTVAIMKILPVIASLGVRVMFVEEAAEVLESHVLACITRRLAHLFLIGDHKQLKPQVEEYELETRQNLGVSLMERLAIVGYPLVTLTTQRRMHPEISVLTKKYYKTDGVDIMDHPCTERTLIPGLGTADHPRRLVFVSYTPTEVWREEQDPNLDSPYNTYEIGMAAAVFHFMHVVQGISVTVLVPYTAQKLHARQYFEQRRLPTRISTVDEYQGDEDTAIILSLTRTDRPGFLNTLNRSCVALSRARDLFVVIGARSVIESPKCTNDMLREFVAHCDQTGASMEAMQVHCPRHRRAIQFSSWEDYESQGLGKCSEPCDGKQECGHVCRSLCHGLRDHPPCRDPCARRGAECDPPRTCAHPCVKKCSARCGLCAEPVVVACKDCKEPQTVPCHLAERGEQNPCKALRTLEAACGHEVQAPCHEHSSGFAHRTCGGTCNVTMSCGHVCERRCHHGHDNDHKKAVKRCEKPRRDAAPCGHDMVFKCNAHTSGNFPMCKEPCPRSPPCGRPEHSCKDVCGRRHQCCCKNNVTVRFDCGHSITAPCAQEPSMCRETCGAPLPCGHPCGEACGDCRQRTFHLCKKRCEKPLLCRHECGKGCDEACDELCQHPCVSQPCKHGSGCAGAADPHTCGDCVLRCQEACLWQCPHHRCQKRCFEVCDRPVCRLRCEKKLPCGHQCAGLCGEECLDYCPQCYAASPETYPRGEVVSFVLEEEDCEKLLRGTYTDEGEEGGLLHRMPCGKMLRVVELEKTLEVAALNGEVKMPNCPLCNTPLGADDFRRSGPLIRRAREHIIEIRQRLLRDRRELRRDAGRMVTSTVDEILDKVLGLNDVAREAAAAVAPMKLTEVPPAQKKGKKMRKVIERHREVYMAKLAQRQEQIQAMKAALVGAPPICGDVLEFLFNMRDGPASNVERLGDLCRLAAERVTCAALAREHGTTGNEVRSTLEIVQGLCEEPNEPIWAKKRAQDIRGIPLPEMEWTRRLIEARVVGDRALVDRVSAIHAAVMRNRGTPIPASVVGEIERAVGSAGRRALLQNITRAIGVTAGHWYSCPNGHLYVIGDCGGAMMRSRCPDCGAEIGGESHRVVASNNSAAGMVQPGAEAAWPMGR